MSSLRAIHVLSLVLWILSGGNLSLIEAAAGDPENCRIRGENGEISLTIAVALTENGKITGTSGWMHMAAMLMAVDHFNDRDPVVIQELAELQDCGLKIVNVSVVDTGTTGHRAMKTILQAAQKNGGPPDAMVGPFNELPAHELSVMATGMEAPLVAIRGTDHNLIIPDKHPFYTQMNPDLYGEMEIVGDYLKHRGRTNYIAILYSSDDSVLQRVEMLRRVLKQNVGVEQIKTYSYQAVDKTYEGEDRGVRDAVWKVAQTGFRTILLITETPDLDTALLSEAAHDFELDRGGYFWILAGGLDASSVDKDAILVQQKLSHSGGFLRGATYIGLFEGFYLEEDNAFNATFTEQNATFVQRLRDINPVSNFFEHDEYGINYTSKEDEVFPADDIFQKLTAFIDYVAFSYDAAMAIGIGACLAVANQNGTAMTGEQHLDGIRAVSFNGTSGQVKFGDTPETPGSRVGRSVYHAIFNLLPHGDENDVIVEPTDYLDPSTGKWVFYQPYFYSDGTNRPPELLRTIPEQNYLETGVLAAGLSLAAIALFTISLSAIWVWLRRTNAVVIAAQPPFLYVLCLGSILTTLVIIISSFDEGSGWDDDMLDAACIAIPWLLALGHIVTYSALFTKLWRVNKVLQFKRARIKVRQVVWPAVLLMGAATVVLAVFTATGDFNWERTEIDELTGESIGRCKGDNSLAFLLPVGIICLVPTILTGIMAWKTSDVDDVYSESKWIFTLILVQLQVLVVAAPVVAILQDVSTNGRYIGLTLIVWTFPMSTMGLILTPKMLVVRRERLGYAKGEHTRGSTGQVRVTGLQDNNHVQAGDLVTEPSSNNPGLSSSTGVGSPRIQTVTME